MRLFLALLIPCCLLTMPAFTEEGTRVGKMPLDLPSGGLAGDEDDEDAPESIVFYGMESEGDAFMFCFPVYGFCGQTDAYNAIKAELTQTLGQLSPASDFSMVGFNSQTYIWSTFLKAANAANKSSAIAWMNSMIPTEAHNLVEAALAALNIINTGQGNAKVMFQMGVHAPPNPAGAISQITAANYQAMPINCIYFTSNFYSGEAEFFINLAASNSGSFQQIDY